GISREPAELYGNRHGRRPRRRRRLIRLARLAHVLGAVLDPHRAFGRADPAFDHAADLAGAAECRACGRRLLRPPGLLRRWFLRRARSRLAPRRPVPPAVPAPPCPPARLAHPPR